MAHYVFTDAYLSIGGTDVSAHVESLTVTRNQETPDDTTMGATFRKYLPGLQDYSLAVVFHQDHADNDLSEDVEALFGTTFAVAWRPDNTTISASNPENQFTGVLADGGEGGTVGEINKLNLSIKQAGSGVTRDVTP